MKIRKATTLDLESILDIYAGAREFMRQTGNGNQWKNIYPTREIIEDDIKRENLYAVCEDEIIHAVFAFIPGVDPTYNEINGKWLNDKPYAAMHRVASAGKKKGMLHECVKYALQHTYNIKIDTHHDNKVMQHQLEKEGFVRCGIIKLANGEPRIAYQKETKTMKIEEIDKNFKPTSACGRDDIVFIDCMKKPIKIFGLLMPTEEEGFFRRVPKDIADGTNEGVALLSKHTAGGRVKFKTNSPFIAIQAKLHEIGKMPHFATTGSAGFDLYKNEGGEDIYRGTFFPPYNLEDGFEFLLDVGATERDYTINFPLYSGVKELKIGLKAGSSLSEAAGYEITDPIVYYGSSITQGGCASRPGNAYQAIISRKLNCDHINLGFSGSARGEDIMGDYIAGLKMSAFVLDYDHNAPTATHLEETHEKFFKQIREKNPELPVIMMSRPQIYLSEDEKRRRDIVKKTYENAMAKGDKNVYFVDGSEIMKIFGGDSGTVDYCHPNDLGFMCMAEALLPHLKRIFNK